MASMMAPSEPSPDRQTLPPIQEAVPQILSTNPRDQGSQNHSQAAGGSERQALFPVPRLPSDPLVSPASDRNPFPAPLPRAQPPSDQDRRARSGDESGRPGSAASDHGRPYTPQHLNASYNGVHAHHGVHQPHSFVPNHGPPSPYSMGPSTVYPSEATAPYAGGPQAEMGFAQASGAGASELGLEMGAGEAHRENARKRRGNLPRQVTDTLRKWFEDHIEHPYPSDEEKQELMQETQLAMSQISNWFINARRRRDPHRAPRRQHSARDGGSAASGESPPQDESEEQEETD